MASSLDLNTPNGQVRAIIGDLDAGDPIFPYDPNDAIDAFLSVARNNNVQRAAALALRAIAADQILTKKKFKLMEVEVDTAPLARELRSVAKDLDAQANSDEGIGSGQGSIEAIAAVIA